jgi:uncharacterized RDD family membrane protein YckC
VARDKRQAAGSWLEGPAFQRETARGAKLGLPAEGPGSLASTGQRMVGFLIDGIVANLLAGLPYLFGVRYGQGERGYAVYAAFLLQEFILVSIAGATVGKQLVGIKVVRADGGRVAWPWVLARTLLLGFLVPAVIWDRDGRGLHDRAAGALTVRTGCRAVASSAPPAARVQPSTQRNGARPASSGRASPPVRRRKKRR